MEVVEVLVRMGGVADTRRLVRATSRKRVHRAVERGDVVRDARGRYALPAADEARRAASRLSGVISGLSAAGYLGWEVKTPPSRPSVTVPAKRRVDRERRRGVDLRWRDVPPDDVWDGVLRPGPTFVDCAKTLPFDEALAVADSALRHGHLTPQRMLALAEQVQGRGRQRVMRVARAADGDAANPFESVLRAIALEIPGLDVRPQVVLSGRGFAARPDLVDVERRIVLEADSFAWHGGRAAHDRDCERYNALVARGWRVLRFTWEQVMHRPDYVREVLTMVVAGADGQELVPRTARRTA